MKSSSRFTSRRDRRGQSLILVLFVLIAIVGVLALTLDYGFVLLARRQMQTGVNAAALEGLRGADDPSYEANGQQLRRENARRVLRLNFDDDFDLAANETMIGAGVSGDLIQGDVYRQATIGPAYPTLKEDLNNRPQFIYRPDDFQLNREDEPHGDMVVGGYLRDDEQHREYADYSRTDFDPSSDGAFLVRLRRTHDPHGLDAQDGISSHGTGLPLILGRLGWFAAMNAGDGYSVRRDGVTVRAAAIAEERVAVKVWRTSSPEVYSATRFGIEVAELLGDDPVSKVRQIDQICTHVGEYAILSDTSAPPPDSGYVAVIDTALGHEDNGGLVIGFYLYRETDDDERLPNASPRIQDAWEDFGQLEESQRDQIRESQIVVREQLVKVPSLVRSTR